jgi:hypothetical protein
VRGCVLLEGRREGNLLHPNQAGAAHKLQEGQVRTGNTGVAMNWPQLS